MWIRNEFYTNLGRRSILWSHCDSGKWWTYRANPIATWIKRLVLQRGVVYAVEICRIKGVESNFGQIHVVETEHDCLDRSDHFQALRMAYVCCKTASTPCVLDPKARKARGKAEVQHEDHGFGAFQSPSEVSKPVTLPVQRLPKTAEILLVDCKLTPGHLSCHAQ